MDLYLPMRGDCGAPERIAEGRRQVTAYLILSNSEPKDKPEMSIRIDDDGDIWLKFSERGGELSVVLNQRQFLEFVKAAEIKRGEL